MKSVPYDEGLGFCIMKDENYQQKLRDILEGQKFEKVLKTGRKNYSLAIEEKMNKGLKCLPENKEIDEHLHEAQVHWTTASPLVRPRKGEQSRYLPVTCSVSSRKCVRQVEKVAHEVFVNVPEANIGTSIEKMKSQHNIS